MFIYLKIGCYELEADAGRAYDEAAKLLKGPSCKLNFGAEMIYLQARGRELHKRGIGLDDVESYDIVELQIKENLQKISSEVKDDNAPCNTQIESEDDTSIASNIGGNAILLTGESLPQNPNTVDESAESRSDGPMSMNENKREHGSSLVNYKNNSENITFNGTVAENTHVSKILRADEKLEYENIRANSEFADEYSFICIRTKVCLTSNLS